MVLRSRSNRCEGDSELPASIRIRASRKFVPGFVHRVLRAPASNRSSQRASLRAACDLHGAPRKWVCVLASTLRWLESAFAHPREQFLWQPGRRAASESRGGSRADAPPPHSAIVRAVPRSAEGFRQDLRATLANTDPCQRSVQAAVAAAGGLATPLMPAHDSGLPLRSPLDRAHRSGGALLHGVPQHGASRCRRRIRDTAAWNRTQPLHRRTAPIATLPVRICPMPSVPQWQREIAAGFSDSSKQEMPRPHEDKNQHKKREKETANNLLMLELHW